MKTAKLPMTDAVHLLLATAAGMLLGACYFGGLWWTVQRALTSARPARWFLGSLWLRLGLALGGFYLVGDGHWQRLALCLLGFIAARLILQRFTRLPVRQWPDGSPQASHAP